MDLSARLLSLYDRLGDLHTLLILLQSRDPKTYPLPGNADELLDESEEQLNAVRDELMALSKQDGRN